MPGPFAITDRVTLGIKPEAVFGTIPVAGNYYLLRIMQENLKYSPKFVQSQELTGDRQIRDLILVDADAAGDIGSEMSYGEHDFLMAAALGGIWGNYAGTNGDTGVITVTITLANTITASAGTPFTNMAVGQWFRMSGMVNAQNNNLFQVVTVAPTVITTAAAALVNEVATATAKVQAARLVNSTNVITFVPERKNTDLTQFEAFRGMGVNNMAMAFKLGSILQNTFSMIGKDAMAMQATTRLPGTPTASQTGAVMNSVNNVSNIYEGGALLTSTYLQSLDVKSNGNLRALKALANLGAVGLNLGELDVEVSFTGYLADSSIYNKYINGTPTSFSVRLTDSIGQAYVLTFPYAKYQDASRPTGGKNQDVILSANLQVLKDPVSGVSMVIDRCGAAITPWA